MSGRQTLTRMFRRSPGYASAAIATPALGIGLATAVFTVGDAMLIKRLPVANQDRLLVMSGRSAGDAFSNYPLPLADVREFERRSNTLSDVAFFAFRGATATAILDADRVYQIQASLVSGNFFDVAEVQPQLGRLLRADDDVEGAAPVLVISNRAWKERFGSDTSIVGRAITIVSSGESYQVVGVMPQGLDYPRGTEVWLPLVAYSAAGGFLEIASGELDMLTRLRVGASPNQAKDELTGFLHRPEAPAWQRELQAAALPLPEVVLGNTKAAVILVSIAAAILLLITCANVANLALVNALRRVKEFAVRSALGATRRMQVTQLLSEGAAIALIGGALGFLLAVGGVKLFVHFAPLDLPRVDEVIVSTRVLIAAILVTSIAMLFSNVGPAFIATRGSALEALVSGGRTTGGRSSRRVAELLVVAHMALAVLSLTAAGLVVRSFITLSQIDLSFDRHSLMVASLAFDGSKLQDSNRQRIALDQVVAAVRVLRGVQGASPTFSVPFVGASGGIDARLSRLGQSAPEAALNPLLNMEVIAPDYFELLGTPILTGRPFSEEDREGSPAAAIISRSVAQRFWPDDNPVGKRLQSGRRQYTVVGEVPDTRYRELENARPSVYFPMSQSSIVPTNILIRTSGSGMSIASSLRNVISLTQSGIELSNISPLEQLIQVRQSQPRLNAVVLVAFAGCALLLAAVGLFAVIVTMVRMRVYEFGVRMALGATSGQVGRMVLSRGVAIAIVGTVAGLSAAFAASRLMSSLLFEVSSSDPLTFAIVAATVVAVALLAGIAPARIGMQVDPAIALRSES